jgi:hypothetical protein
MNKLVLMGIFVTMSVAGVLMTGCSTDTTENPPPNTPPAVNDKVVAEKYQGKWADENNSSIYYVFNEKTMVTPNGLTVSAYTEGNVLYVISDDGSGVKSGTFVTDTRFKDDFDAIYLKQ